MAVEIDHLFICTSVGAEDAARLSEFGLTEGTPNVHPGQGTACRRFFFANCYLELLWVCNSEDVQSASTRPTRLAERWENRAGGACPFGLCFRPKIQHDGEIPFSSWQYRPSYLPAPLSIHVATNANELTEPMLFYLLFAQRPDGYPSAKQPPLRHLAGLREVTRVEFASPHANRISPELASVTRPGQIGLHVESEYLIEVGFDGESRGQQADFRPALPLRFRW